MPADEEDLVPVRCSADEFDLRPLQTEPVAKDLDECRVRPAVLRRRGDRHLQCPGLLAEHGVLLAPGCARTASVAPSACGVMVIGTLGESLEQRCPDAHERRPFLNRDLEVAAHSHRQFRQLQPRACTQVVAKSRSSANVGRAASGSSEYAAIVISPRTDTPDSDANFVAERRHRLDRRSRPWRPPGYSSLPATRAPACRDVRRKRRVPPAVARNRPNESVRRAGRCGRSCFAAGVR